MSSPYIYFVISLCILQIQLPVTNPAPSRNKNYVVSCLFILPFVPRVTEVTESYFSHTR